MKKILFTLVAVTASYSFAKVEVGETIRKEASYIVSKEIIVGPGHEIKTIIVKCDDGDSAVTGSCQIHSTNRYLVMDHSFTVIRNKANNIVNDGYSCDVHSNSPSTTRDTYGEISVTCKKD